MKEFSDEELLREYAATGSGLAFTELVKRHGDMVHSIAARMVDWDTAKDVRLTPMDPERDLHWAVDSNGPRSARIRSEELRE